MTHQQNMGIPLVDANIRPFAFQYYARDFYEAYKKHKSGPRFSPARYFLLSRSIELAAKSLHLADGKPAEELGNVNHNLESACDTTILNQFGISLNSQQLTELKKANDYYQHKGFEYYLYKSGDWKGSDFGSSGPEKTLQGWPDLPDLNTLESIFEMLLSIDLK
jgi:hypothetical protein